MSVGHLCEYCGQGRVRPFQFSLEQAVVTCDNLECDSRLELSPWECIIDRNIRQTNSCSADQGRLLLWSRSSSSSGVHSDYRSPALSPARSCDSVTDREVENLLRRSFAPPPKVKHNQFKNQLSQCHHSAITGEKVTEIKSNDSFASFFELLNNLDLDVPPHQLVKKDCMPMSPLCDEEASVDTVTSELESWMKNFELPGNTISNELHSICSAPKQNAQIDLAECHSFTKDKLYIPSKGSAFSQVSPKKDSFKQFSIKNSVDGHSDSEVKKTSENSIIPCEKSCDVSKNELSSICDTQFLSPAASAVSDDSGYEDSTIKANLVSVSLYLSERERDSSSSFSVLEMQKKDGICREAQSSSPSVSESVVDMKVTDSYEREASALSPVLSSGLFSDSVAGEIFKMDLEEEKTCSPEPTNFSNSSRNSLLSSQPSETEKCTSETKTLEDKNNAKTSQNKYDSSPFREACDKNNGCSKTDTVVEDTRKLKRPGRPKGSWRKSPLEVVKRNRRVPRQTVIRKEEEESNVASLRKGLASLLQAPSLVQIKKNENRNQNLTNLSLRNRLNGSFVQDPWSVPELYLEELSIEVVVQGPTRSRNEKHPSNANTCKSDICKSEVKEGKENEKHSEGDVNLEKEVLLENGENIKNIIPLDTSVPKESAEAKLLDSKSEVKNTSHVPVEDDDDSKMTVCSYYSDTSGESCSSQESEEALLPGASNSSSCSPSCSSSSRDVSCKQDAKNIDTESSKGLNYVSSSREITQANVLEKISVDLKSEKQVLKTFLDDGFFEDITNCDVSNKCSALSPRSFRTVNVGRKSFTAKLDYFGEDTNSEVEDCQDVTNQTATHRYQEFKDAVDLKDDKAILKDNNVLKRKIIQLPVTPVKNISYDQSEKCTDSFAKDSLHKLSTLPEFTSQFLFDSPETKDIRSWIGIEEEDPLMKILEEKDNMPAIKSTNDDYVTRATMGSSSKYFSALLQDVIFEDEFFLCPTTENPGSTFNEHLSGSLFFGETAQNNTSSDIHSPFSTTTTTTAAIGNENCNVPLPTSTNAFSLPRTPLSLEESEIVVSCRNSCSSSSTPDTCVMSSNASVCQVATVNTINVHVDTVVTSSKEFIPKTSTAIEDTSRSSSITKTAHLAYTSCQSNPEEEYSQLPCHKSNWHTNCEYADKGVSKFNSYSKNAILDCSAYLEIFSSIPSPVSEDIKFEPELCKNMCHCSERNVLKDRTVSLPYFCGGFYNDKRKQISSSREFSLDSKTPNSLTEKSEKDIPTITVDSDDEFQILMPKKEPLSENSLSHQDCVTSPNINKTEPEMEEKMKMKSPYSGKAKETLDLKTLKLEHTSFIQKRKCEDSYNIINKKWKSDPAQEKRDDSIKNKIINKANIGSSSDDSESENLMCGIMDNSIVHDANCYSPRSKGFIEFDKHLRPDKPPENLRFYFGSKTTNFKLCEDVKIMCDTKPTVKEENFSNITLKSSDLKSPSKFSSAFSFNVDKKFGCTKSSPQHESCKYTESDESNAETVSWASRDLSFLCFETSSESCSSSEDDDSQDFRRKEIVAPLTKKRHETDISTCERELFLPTFGFETGTSQYDGSGEESESDCEVMQKSSKPQETEICSKNSLLNVKESDLKFIHQKPNCINSANGSSVPFKLSHSQLVVIPTASRNFPNTACEASPSHGSADPLINLRVPFTPKFHNSTIKEKRSILNNSDPQKVAAFQNPSQQDDKSVHQPTMLHNLEPTSAHHPQPIKVSLHPVAPKLLTSVSLGSHSVSQISESTRVKQPPSATSEAVKSKSVIDCHIPSPKYSSTLIPPALLGSYADNFTTNTLHTSPAHSIINKNSKTVSNVQEKIIAVKTMTPSGPVMRLLRVNVVSSKPKENVHVENGHRIGAAAVENMPVANSAVSDSFSKMASTFTARVNKTTDTITKKSFHSFCDVSTATVNRDMFYARENVIPRPLNEDPVTGIKLGLSSLKESSTDTENQGIRKGESKELFTKIKIGSGDKFYIRPTPAMLKAISNVKKKQQETQEETVKYIELPDGIPISHPIFLSRPISTDKNVRKKRREKRKKRKVYRLEEYRQSRKRIRQLVNKTVEETVTRNKDEIPAMVVVCVGGKLHIYSRETDSALS